MGDITIPNIFVSQTLIESAAANANFAALAEGALNKADAAGDTMVGPATFQNDVSVGGNLTVTGTITGAISVAAEDLSGTTINAGVTASSLTTVGTVTSGTWSASFGAVSGANLTSLNASNLASGTVNTARLSGITTSQMASANVSQFTNDAGYLTSATLDAVPVGAMTMWVAAAAPTGWLLCQGQGLSTGTYPALFAVIGYGYGGSAGTFNLPDMQGRFPLGKAAAGTGSTLAGTGGSLDHTHTGAAHTHTLAHTHTYSTVIAHTHSVTDSGHTHTYLSAGGSSGDLGSGSDRGATVDSNNSGSSVTGISIVSTGSASGTTSAASTSTTGSDGTGATSSNNPPYLVVNYIIKY